MGKRVSTLNWREWRKSWEEMGYAALQCHQEINKFLVRNVAKAFSKWQQRPHKLPVLWGQHKGAAYKFPLLWAFEQLCHLPGMPSLPSASIAHSCSSPPNPLSLSLNLMPLCTIPPENISPILLVSLKQHSIPLLSSRLSYALWFNFSSMHLLV